MTIPVLGLAEESEISALGHQVHGDLNAGQMKVDFYTLKSQDIFFLWSKKLLSNTSPSL